MFIQLVTIRGVNWTAPRCCERERFKARLTNEIKLSENRRSQPIKLSDCSSAGHITATFTTTSKHKIKNKASLRKGKGVRSNHRILHGNFFFNQKCSQEIAVAINLGWPYQGWYCISFPQSEILILEIHVTLAHFNFMFSHNSELFGSFVLLKQHILTQCHTEIYLVHCLEIKRLACCRDNGKVLTKLYWWVRGGIKTREMWRVIHPCIWLPICRKVHSIQMMSRALFLKIVEQNFHARLIFQIFSLPLSLCACSRHTDWPVICESPMV